jgi:hypothetical protein
MLKSLFGISHGLWVIAQLRAPGWVRDIVIPHLHAAKELVRLRPYLAVHRLYGQNRGGPLTVDYVGLNYRPTLVDALFTEEPVIQAIGRVATWRNVALANCREDDLVVVAGSKYLIRKLPRQNAIVLPFYVRMVLNVQGSWEDVRARIHKSVRKNELRLMRKYGYEYEISDREEDFDKFYHKMYMPTIKMRKGDLASPMSVREAYQYFRYGSLLHLIKRDGQHVAGGLSYVEGDLVRFRLMGMLNGDENLIREGALAGCYYAVVHWANREGHRSVVFGDCVPLLENGVFQYKRKWGGVVTYSDRVHKQVWIRVQRDTPPVRQFFKDNPFIIIDEHGQLQGLIVTDDPDNVPEAVKNEWNKKYATPGLGGLLIRSITDLFDGSIGIAKTEKVVSTLVN